MKILLGDEHLQIREDVENVIRKIPGIDEIDEVFDGSELLAKVSDNSYDIVILDMSLPGISVLDFISGLKRTRIKANILLYSFDPKKEYAMFALRKGASGYLSNPVIYDELPKAIRHIRKGGRYVSTESA